MSADRASVLGCAIDRLDMDGTLERCAHAIETGGFLQHVSVNAAKLVAMRADPRQREVVERCELVSADGQSVVWASMALGDPLPERVAGIDLMGRLLALAEQRSYGVFILGARPEILERAVTNLRERHPGLALVGHRDGYYSEEETPEVCAQIRAARPDILLVAMSSPRKEYFLGEHARELGASVAMGVGGSIDVVAGTVRRAPRCVQGVGLEWLWRLAQEPRRLARRYMVTNTRFGLLLGLELLRRLPAAGR